VTLLNAGISFALSDSTRVFARGQNLLDKKYQQVLGYRAAGVTASIGIMATLH
jgi:outer membrane cobalamin receptor